MNIQTEKAYVGYYATTDDYDGAPDAGFPANCIGWGETPEEAKAETRIGREWTYPDKQPESHRNSD